MPRQISLIAVLPGAALSDRQLTPEQKVVLAGLFLLVDGVSGLCTKENTRISSLCGMSPKTSRAAIKKLKDNGWVDEETEGFRPLLISSGPPPVVEERPVVQRPLFHKSNVAMDESQVNHLIKVFIGSGLNPKLQGPVAEKRTYASPWNRHGAHELIVKHGVQTIEETLNKLSERKGEIWCPSIDSLQMLNQKWEKVDRFLNGNGGGAMVV